MQDRKVLIENYSLALTAVAMFSLAIPSTMASASETANDITATESLKQLETGEQYIIENRNGEIEFAGRKIILNNFSGVFGYGSDVAYVLSVAGEAQLNNLTARKGRMLLIQPYEESPLVERFDAARLRVGWLKNSKTVSTSMAEKLNGVARSQKTGIFLGTLGRTNFNVTTLGSEMLETTRRDVLGGNAVRDIRFKPAIDGRDIEQEIIFKFINALVQQDALAVAELLDPLPFGYDSPGSDGSSARLLMASALIKSRDWQSLQSSNPEKQGETRWIASAGGIDATIDIRRTTDFAFIQSISVGE